MESILTGPQKDALKRIFDSGAGTASLALSRWLGQSVSIAVNAVEEVDLASADELLGPAEELVAACVMGISGRLAGLIVLVFEDRSGLALADLLLNQPLGTATAWGELERSAALETANIVSCAYLNSLATHLPVGEGGEATPLVPSPPGFRHEFAGSLVQMLLMDQALQFEHLLLVNSQFATDQRQLRWTLLFAPDAASLHSLAAILANPVTP